MKCNINLNSISSVKDFVAAASTIEGDVLITTLDGKYRIDGKSILGLFSLDLTKNLALEIQGEITPEMKKVLEKVKA